MTAQNAVAKRDDKAPPAPLEAGGEIRAIIPQNVEQAFRLATALAQSGNMVPSAYQGKPNEIMAAILRGAEVGLAPMQALSSIAVINGRPSLWGDALPALMQRAGHHVDVRLDGEGDKAVAIATLTRGDSGRTIERRFSMADAKRAGLLGKQGPWAQYPQRMLAHRARSWAIRDGAADALMGLSTVEEAYDVAPEGPDRARDVTPRRNSAVRFRAPDPDPVVEPAETFVDAETGEVSGPDYTLTDEDRERIAAEVRATSDAEAAAFGGDAK